MLLLPFGLSIGAAGAALAGWRPRLALMALGAAIAISFFLLEFGLVFGWPAWLLRLSVFELYGTPLVTGIWWPGLATILILSAAGFGIAAAALQIRGHRTVGGWPMGSRRHPHVQATLPIGQRPLLFAAIPAESRGAVGTGEDLADRYGVT